MPATDKTKRIVWILCGGRCAMCREPLCVPGQELGFSHLIGDIAHIVAEDLGGPRGTSDLSLFERNSEPNLLLLCLKHHKIVDDDPANHTVEYLDGLRLAHHNWVANCLSSMPTWQTKMFQLYYINVPRLSLLTALSGKSLDLAEFGEFPSLHELGWELNKVMSGFKSLLQQVELKAVSLIEAMTEPDPRGFIVSFDQEFRTKNINMPKRGASYASHFTGDLKMDPHIYAKIGDLKVVARIDTRWVTTTTSFCHFHPSGGRNRFAGLAFVNSCDRVRKIISLTPYVLGLASTEFLESFYGELAKYNSSEDLNK